MFAVVVFLIDPCKERLVELIQGEYAGSLYFGDEVVDAKAVERLDLAVALGSIGGGVDGFMDAKFRAEDLHMV